MRAATYILLALAQPAAAAWDDWECPGFPCFITNYFEYRPYQRLSQTCGLVSSMDPCNNLIEGKPLPVYWGNGTLAGNHNIKNPHPCKVAYFGGCVQTTCLQGSVHACQADCAKLQMLPLYNASCYDMCATHCP